MVDVFEVIDGEKLAWKQGVKIIPVGKLTRALSSLCAARLTL